MNFSGDPDEFPGEFSPKVGEFLGEFSGEFFETSVNFLGEFFGNVLKHSEKIHRRKIHREFSPGNSQRHSQKNSP